MASGYTATQLAALKAALASGELRVTYNGHTVEYRGIADLRSAIETVENGLAADAGTRTRVVRAYSSKGT